MPGQYFSNAGFAQNLIETKVAIGKPAEEILKEADQGEYNLIVMGKEGRTALKDIMLGGVELDSFTEMPEPDCCNREQQMNIV